MSDNPTPQTVEPPVRKPHSAQDQVKANLINARRTSLLAVQGNAEAVTRLDARGYGQAGLEEGLAACDTAQTTFDARQLAMDERSAASRIMKKLDKEAHEDYAGFSRIATKVFQTNPTAKAAVVIPARDLKDQEKFLSNTTAAYNTALTRSTYLAALSKRGYTQEVLQAALQKLQALSQASAAFETAKAAAMRATQERDAAIKALTLWWSEFSATAQVVFKDRPDMVRMLEE